MSRHVCDCGQVYGSTDAVLACQNANHSAALGNELADAEAFERSGREYPRNDLDETIESLHKKGYHW